MFTVTLVSGIAICLYAFRKYREIQWGFCKSTRNMKGKVVLITGANSGIGKETARELAKRGAIVILACRNKHSALQAVCDIRQTTENGDLIIVKLDLADLSSIRECASNLLKKFSHIDVLINNAGVYVPPEMKMVCSSEVEIHFGVNHLGHFLFTNLLRERLAEVPESRIVIVSSQLYKSGKIDFETLGSSAEGESLKERKGRNPLYSDSKLCNILHAQELKRRLEAMWTEDKVLLVGDSRAAAFRREDCPTPKVISCVGMRLKDVDSFARPILDGTFSVLIIVLLHSYCERIEKEKL